MFVFRILEHSTGISFYLKTGFAWICGLEKSDELDVQSLHSNSAPNDKTSSRRSICVLREPNISSWHKYCSYGAVVILSFCVFIWAFFTDYRIRLN